MAKFGLLMFDIDLQTFDSVLTEFPTEFFNTSEFFQRSFLSTAGRQLLLGIASCAMLGDWIIVVQSDIGSYLEVVCIRIINPAGFARSAWTETPLVT